MSFPQRRVFGRSHSHKHKCNRGTPTPRERATRREDYWRLQPTASIRTSGVNHLRDRRSYRLCSAPTTNSLRRPTVQKRSKWAGALTLAQLSKVPAAALRNDSGTLSAATKDRGRARAVADTGITDIGFTLKICVCLRLVSAARGTCARVIGVFKTAFVPVTDGLTVDSVINRTTTRKCENSS